MSKPTDIRIKAAKSSTQQIDYRTPIKFGGRVVVDVTLLNIEVEVETADGRRATGCGSTPVGNAWGWPSQRAAAEETLAAMIHLGQRLTELADTYDGSGHPLEITHDLATSYATTADAVVSQAGLAEPMPRLAQLVSASPLEAAIHDAFGKALQRNSYDVLGSEFANADLSTYLSDEFQGEFLDRYTRRDIQPSMPIYHLVGALDPLTDGDISQRLDDGMPETLGEWILADGLTHLKIKLAGDDLQWDVDRVSSIDTVAEAAQNQRGCRAWYYSLDFNEKCANVQYVLDFLAKLTERSPSAMQRVQYIEQPTHRDLRSNPENKMQQAAAIKPVVIDESLVDYESLLLAREQGYSGVALKACKGHSEALVMGAAAQKYGMFLCVQDLTCVGASFLHSASLAARIPTIAAIEGNGRQYCPAGNRPWMDRFPGMFHITDGTVKTAELTGVGLGYERFVKNLVTDRGTLRPMLRLALPVLAEETLNLMVAYTDWWLVGHCLEGPSYKAAMGLMSYTMWLVPSMFAAAAIGATALVARHTGAGQTRRASHVTNQALLVGIVFALVAILVAALLGRPFINVMQLQGSAANHAWVYLRVLIPVIPLIMIERVGIACLHGAGDTVTGLVTKIIVNIVNVGLSASLVTGWGPFPNLGWTGIAIGTAAAHLVGGLILLGVFARGRFGLRLRRSDLRPRLFTIRRVLRIGLPGGADIAAILACHLIYVAIINRLGTDAAAAHGLGIQIEAMAYLPGTAFSVAASTMAGQYLGARDPHRATRGVLGALAVGGSVLSVAALVFYFGGAALTTFFTGSADDVTGRETAELLKIVAFATPGLAVIMVLSGACRGAGDTRWPLLINLVGFIGVRLPGACLLAWSEIDIPILGLTIRGFGLGVAGAWYAMAADVILRALMFAAHFIRGSWKRAVV